MLLALVALITAFAWRGARRRWRERAILGATAVIALAALTPLSDVLLAPLEDRFPPLQVEQVPGDVRTIVVLGGVSRGIVIGGERRAEYSAAIDRVTYTAELATRLPAARVLICAGTADASDDTEAEAHTIASLLEQLGVDPARISKETRSTSTAANARNAMAFLKPGERIILVTSAFHMPRAVGAFRAEGLAVLAAPTDWRLKGAPAGWTRAASEGLSTLDMALHEYAGLVIYWVRGQSRDLFPGVAEP